MTTNADNETTDEASPAWGWEASRRAQLRAGLALTPAERLAWLERTNAEMRELLGRARHARAGVDGKAR